MIILLLLLYYQRNRRREAEQQAKIQALNAELAARRENLSRVLRERVRLTQRMQMSEIVEGHSKAELPDWAQHFIDMNILTTPKQWDEFLSEFNAASNNLLEHLRSEHPSLTKADMLIIALILSELSIQDICILLNQTKHTVWSRRLRIKTHLELTESDNLDEWLKRQLAANS